MALLRHPVDFPNSIALVETNERKNVNAIFGTTVSVIGFCKAITTRLINPPDRT